MWQGNVLIWYNRKKYFLLQERLCIIYAEDLHFEFAARLRDEIQDLKKELRAMRAIAARIQRLGQRDVIVGQKTSLPRTSS